MRVEWRHAYVTTSNRDFVAAAVELLGPGTTEVRPTREQRRRALRALRRSASRR